MNTFFTQKRGRGKGKGGPRLENGNVTAVGKSEIPPQRFSPQLREKKQVAAAARILGEYEKGGGIAAKKRSSYFWATLLLGRGGGELGNYRGLKGQKQPKSPPFQSVRCLRE